MMAITEELIATAAQRINGTMKVNYGDLELDLTPPWPRKTYDELMRQYAGVSMFDGRLRGPEPPNWPSRSPTKPTRWSSMSCLSGWWSRSWPSCRTRPS